MTQTIKVRYLSDKVERLKYVDGKSDWIDLSAAKSVFMPRGTSDMIPLGVAIQLPDGYEALVIPRSSTFGRYGILMTNSVGLIDESYRGDDDQWYFPAYAVYETYVPAGARICQFRIFKHQPTLVFQELEHFDAPNRGGFGSTGV